MDLQKEREAFEDWYCKNHTALKQSDLAKFRTLSDYSFSDSLKINISWEAWQAAKDASHNQVALYQSEINHLAQANQEWREKAAQAIPDGFVVVPIRASEKTKQNMLKVFNESDGFLNCDNIYKTMIEAQEQK